MGRVQFASPQGYGAKGYLCISYCRLAIVIEFEAQSTEAFFGGC